MTEVQTKKKKQEESNDDDAIFHKLREKHPKMEIKAMGEMDSIRSP